MGLRSGHEPGAPLHGDEKGSIVRKRNIKHFLTKPRGSLEGTDTNIAFSMPRATAARLKEIGIADTRYSISLLWPSTNGLPATRLSPKSEAVQTAWETRCPLSRSSPINQAQFTADELAKAANDTVFS